MENTSTTPTPDRSLTQHYPPGLPSGDQALPRRVVAVLPGALLPRVPLLAAGGAGGEVGRALAARLPALQVGARGIAHIPALPQGVPATLPLHPEVRGAGGGVGAPTGQVLPPPLHLLAPLSHGLFQPGGDKHAEGGSSVAMGQQVTLEQKHVTGFVEDHQEL